MIHIVSLGATKCGSDAVIGHLAAAQDRVMARRQLLGAGLGAGAIKRRTAAGTLVAIFPGVYSLGAPSYRGLLRAGLLAAGDGAVLSHGSAACVHGLMKSRRRVVHVSTTRHVRPRRGLAVHRLRVLPAPEITAEAGLPCTTVARTIVDLVASEPRRIVERAIDEAEFLRTYDQIPVEAALRHGRPGVASLRAIVAKHAPGTTITRSKLEEAFLALCRDSGIPDPVMNAPLVLPSGRAIEVDALWRAVRVAVELDSRSAHLRRRAFESDRERDVELTVAGYVPARFTWLKVTREPRWVTAKVRALTAVQQ